MIMKLFSLSSSMLFAAFKMTNLCYAFTSSTRNISSDQNLLLNHKIIKSHHHSHFNRIRAPPSLFLLQQSNSDDDSWDSPEDYNDDDKSTSSKSSRSEKPSLGINIGAQLEPLTPEQAAELKEEAAQKINEAFDGRLEEITKMKKDIRKDFERSKESLRYASDLRAKEETSKLMSKIDRISNDFLEKNEELRMGTKMSAKADMNNMKEGKGLEVGSWGTIGGMNVGMGMGMKSGGSGLLGSVGSVEAGTFSSTSQEEEIMMEEDENRIIVICDEKQDSNVQKILDRFGTLLSNEFTSSVTIDSYKPTSNIPMGGDNAQCVIISSTSLSNGQSSANNILSRILRRTISPGGGGKVSKPPSHFVILSPLGTERIEKFPYSMTNMMGGNKLKKAREVEEVIISTVKGRLVADSGGSMNGPSLDYTILKLGDIISDDKIVGNKKEGMMNIAPGDSLDGKVGIEAAANTLLQAVLLRPTARNATMSVIGGSSSGDDISENQWEDWFLRLDGPELWRKDGLLSSTNDADVDRKFEQLSNYINEWSDMFKNGAKGTGLTTPVDVVLSKFDNDYESSMIRSKFGVRLEFKATNTGSAYKSKDEERELERQRPGSSNMSSSQQPVTRRQRREGGVEILVEKIEDADGKSDLRVRAKRCNMDDNAVVKELSEETIIKKLGKAVDVWVK